MEICDKIIDANEVKVGNSSHFNLTIGHNWFNELVKSRRNNLSRKEKRNHFIEVDYFKISPELLEKQSNNAGGRIRKDLVTKLKQAGWTVYYYYFHSEGMFVRTECDTIGFSKSQYTASDNDTYTIRFYWNSLFKKDPNASYDFITADEMVPYEYHPSSIKLMKDKAYNIKRPVPFKFNENYSLMENFALWFNKLATYEQTNQTYNEKLNNYYAFHYTDVPSYFLDFEHHLQFSISAYLEQFHWNVTYEGAPRAKHIYFCYAKE